MPTRIKLRGGGFEFAPTNAESDRDFANRNFVKFMRDILDGLEILSDAVDELRSEVFKGKSKAAVARKHRARLDDIDKHNNKKLEIADKIRSAKKRV